MNEDQGKLINGNFIFYFYPFSASSAILRRGIVPYFFVTFTVIVTVIMILAMFIFYFCLKQQDEHCIRHYDCDYDCDYDRKIRYNLFKQ